MITIGTIEKPLQPLMEIGETKSSYPHVSQFDP